MLAITLDIFIIILLMLTIFYCFTLNQKIRLLYQHKDSLQNLLSELGRSLKTAEESMRQLKTISGSAVQELLKETTQAKTLGDELRFFIERGENLAVRLEKKLQAVRQYVTAALVTNPEDVSENRTVPEYTRPSFTIEDTLETKKTTPHPQPEPTSEPQPESSLEPEPSSFNDLKKRFISRLHALR